MDSHVVKVVLVGESRVGKTNLLLRFVDETFDESYCSTPATTFKIRTISNEFHGHTVKFQLWEHIEQRFRSGGLSAYRGAHVFFVVYDVTDEHSFNKNCYWLSDIEHHRFTEEMPMIVLVGNKSDLSASRVITHEQGQSLAASKGISFFEVSAKSSQNVEQLFFEAGYAFLQKRGIINSPMKSARAGVSVAGDGSGPSSTDINTTDNSGEGGDGKNKSEKCLIS